MNPFGITLKNTESNTNDFYKGVINYAKNKCNNAGIQFRIISK